MMVTAVTGGKLWRALMETTTHGGAATPSEAGAAASTSTLPPRITKTLINRLTGLGYLQRGGSPSPQDRLLATRFGTYAAKMLAEGDYGKMVALRRGEVTSVPLEEPASRLKLVPPDHHLVESARLVGTCFGDE